MITSLLLAPYLLLSDYFLYPGQILTVRGGDFPPQEAISLDVGGREYQLRSNALGQLEPSRFLVSDGALGRRLWIKAEGAGESADASLVVGEFYPLVTPTSYYILPGGAVQFTGNHYPPDELVEISSGDGQALGQVTANSNGSFLTPAFNVPYQAGDYSFTFTGKSTPPQTVRVSVGAASTPWILLSSYYEKSGEPLAVHGRGFGRSEPIRIYYDGRFLEEVTGSPGGTFRFDFLVPEAAPGRHEIRARGLYTQATAQEYFTQAPQ